MQKLKTLLPRLAVTLIVLCAAVFGGRALWLRYEVEPWTRDGRVRAKTVQLAPDVSGLVSAVLVKDNATVRAGEVLFRIDPARFELALRQARAALAAQQAAAIQAQRESKRNHALSDLVSTETIEQGGSRLDQAQDGLRQAQVAVDVATLNLQRATVRSPVDGYLSDLLLQPGDYASAGRPALAIVDRGSIHIEGYFEETKLKSVRVGQAAVIHVMGEPRSILGHVDSIAPAIEDRDRAVGTSLLPNVNPTFSWVRLAQRVPVWIAIDRAPEGLVLIPGRTASVELVQLPARGVPRAK
jgi:RND family efflux transporter MFP subunit